MNWESSGIETTKMQLANITGFLNSNQLKGKRAEI